MLPGPLSPVAGPEIVTSGVAEGVAPGGNSLMELAPPLTTYRRPVGSTATPFGALTWFADPSVSSGETFPSGASE